MILTCPECATSYFIPDEALGASGRRVRCQSCAHIWKATPEEPLNLTATSADGFAPSPSSASEFGKREEAPEDLSETPAPELPRAFRARAEQQRRLRRSVVRGVIWAGAASVLAALLIGGWLFRVDVVDRYPPAAAVYSALGAPVNPTGLEFEAVSARPLPNDPGMVLISGAVRNIRDREIVSPPIRVAVLDAQGAELSHKVIALEAAPVLPGGVLGFATLAPNPGSRVSDIGVDFVLDEAAGAPETAGRSSAAGAAPHAETLPEDPALDPTEARPIPATAAESLAADRGGTVSASDHG